MDFSEEDEKSIHRYGEEFGAYQLIGAIKFCSEKAMDKREAAIHRNPMEYWVKEINHEISLYEEAKRRKKVALNV